MGGILSRFGNTATFYYCPNGTFIGSGTYIYLTKDNMPQFPFTSFNINDRNSFRSKNGLMYSYQNYSKNGYEMNFSLMSGTYRDKFRRMYNSNPIFTFNTNNTSWGTFFFEEEISDELVAFDLYDINFKIVER